MRAALTTGVALLSTVLAHTAWADFVIEGAPAPISAQGQEGSAATSKREPGAVGNDAQPDQPRRQLLIAQGFGDQVPLRFAVRQIVPRGIRVTYGRGADPDAAVTWKGGQSWNWVLFNAVHPLGLRLVLTPMQVEIRK